MEALIRLWDSYYELYSPQTKRLTRTFCSNVSIGQRATYYNGYFILCGGIPASKNVYSLDVQHGALKNLPHMNVPRCHHSQTVHRNGLYVIGGLSQAIKKTAEVEYFDGTSWAQMPALHHARAWHASVSHNYKLYVCGGESAPAAIEVFDGDAWNVVNISVKAGCLFFSRMISFTENEILIVGGKTSQQVSYTNDIYLFVPETGRFKTITSLPTKSNFIADAHLSSSKGLLSILTVESPYLLNLNQLRWLHPGDKIPRCYYCNTPYAEDFPCKNLIDCTYYRRRALIQVREMLKANCK